MSPIATLRSLLYISQYMRRAPAQEIDQTVDDSCGKSVQPVWKLSYMVSLTKQIVQSTTIVCYIILSTVRSPVVKYLAIIVATACAGSAYPVIWPERIRDLDNALAAGVGIGFTNAMAQFSGIAGPQIYSTDFGPTYRKSFLTCLALLCGAIAAILASWGLVVLKDRKKARTEA